MDSRSTPPPPRPLHPVRFGRYDLIERIAVGGMAEIFKAKIVGLQGFERTLIIKRMLPQLAQDQEFVDMFIDEARVMGRINHPKIVQVYDFGEVDEQLYIAMEYVDGIDALTLLRRCAEQRLRPASNVALFICAEVLDALDYVHTLTDDDGRPLELVHRDISPSNIFLTRRGDVKLADFGIALAVMRRHVTKVGILKGKYNYMAPEMVAGEQVDHRCDIFSVAVVLAEMLMVRPLFAAKNELDVLLQVRDAQLTRLDEFGRHIPTPVREILEAALSRDPASRYPDAARFRDALLFYLHDAALVANSGEVRRLLAHIADAPQAAETAAASALTRKHLAPGGERSQPPPSWAGRKRKLLLTPPPPPPSLGLLASTAVRLDTADALAAIPELQDPHLPQLHELASAPTGQVTTTPPVPSAEAVIAARTTPHVPDQADERGALDAHGVVRVIFDLAVREETGLVALHAGTTLKEIYLVDGHPQSVTSNQPEDLFGQYLVSERVIADGELSMALAMLSHFHGGLGDALVGLGLLTPMDVLRHLTRQVRGKLIDCFAWSGGSYEYYRGKRSAHESAPLGLDAFELLGAGVNALPAELLARRLEPVLALPLRAIQPLPVPPEVFRLGELPRRLLDALDGERPLEQVLEGLVELGSRDPARRVACLLVQTGLAVA